MLKIPVEQFIREYSINPYSVRELTDYTITQNPNDKTLDFINELLNEKDVIVVKTPIKVKDRVIIDGNIRYTLIKQLVENGIKSELIPIEMVHDTGVEFISQLAGNNTPVSLRQKMKAINKMIEQLGHEKSSIVLRREYGDKYSRYLKNALIYKSLPEWLKFDADLYDISFNTLINFKKEFPKCQKTKWGDIKKEAVLDSTEKLRITPKHIEKVKSSETQEIKNEFNLSECLQRLLNATKEINVESWVKSYEKIAHDPDYTAKLFDTVALILESHRC